MNCEMEPLRNSMLSTDLIEDEALAMHRIEEESKFGLPCPPVLPYLFNLSSESSLELTLEITRQFQTFFGRHTHHREAGRWDYPQKDGSLQVFPADTVD